jgi:hypothetical protein
MHRPSTRVLPRSSTARSACIAVGALWAAAVVPVGCAADSQALRDFIAPDFSRLDDTRLQDAMWRLGGGVQTLDDTLQADNGLSDADRKAQVLATLDVMAEAAASAGAPGQKQRHTNVAMNIDRLIGDIQAARAAAVADDLGPARALPQTCLACHTGGGGGAQRPAP